MNECWQFEFQKGSEVSRVSVYSFWHAISTDPCKTLAELLRKLKTACEMISEITQDYLVQPVCFFVALYHLGLQICWIVYRVLNVVAILTLYVFRL